MLLSLVSSTFTTLISVIVAFKAVFYGYSDALSTFFYIITVVEVTISLLLFSPIRNIFKVKVSQVLATPSLHSCKSPSKSPSALWKLFRMFERIQANL